MNDLLTPIETARPSIIEFGGGLVSATGRWARARGYCRPLVVSDAFNAGRVGLLDLPGEVAVFGEVKPEPDLPNLEKALALAEQVRPDLVVGFGGGSAMDLAKLVAVLPGSGQSFAEVVGPEKVAGRRIGLFQVPTTSGTGSEGGTRALVTDPATQNKAAVQSRHMLADIAIVDPDLTLTVPPAVTAATGVDAMAHCVEAFTSRKAHPLIDLYALEGIRLVGRFLKRAVTDGADREARAGLALASMYGGFCLGPVNTTAGHAVAYPLGTRHHIPHGLACALIFPHTLAFNAPVMAEKTALVLEALGLPASAEEAAVREATHRFCAGLGIEMRLSALGVPRNDLESMAREAHAIRRLLDNNPRELSQDQILAIYDAAY
ncbi:iron-containing alcohol dehydrogenase [Roseomonas gilardii]|uniref:Alcohol dehydrogenase n=1 Tax=Roseomonas gilardii TaxID=257708 RepID=A0A1L7AMF8_9PROT|nr:iron-containing alcohol dehydrogenase [Roseomonas gilardii]APT59938.1 alcohol dehydrogenase [Roseomonas gilardii]MDT8332541.1 iron-containing alcohol dehydrogenase [Roseomonas gilardii]PZR09749.1 MAG: alcohol dehydrogenase [Azospirillum brasilense]